VSGNSAGNDLSAWHGDVVLADGGTVHVRPIRPDDAQRLQDLHGRLSAESIYYRFFSPKPRLTDKEVEKFTTVDFVDRVALVAILGDDIIGVGRYDRWPGRDEAEVAFTVDDAHHGRGISTVLLEHLAAIARQRGINRFTAEVLPDNRAMLSVFRKAGFQVHNEFAGGIVDVAFDIDPTPQFLETVERREQRAEARSIARLLSARSVAVIGASDRPGSVGQAVFHNLLACGFDGPVYPVNPFVPHVASVPAYNRITDVPDHVHLAVVAVPADEVSKVLEECAAKKVRGVIVISTGFSDAGAPGIQAERELVERARRNGMRMIGPASMGLITHDAAGTLHASFAPVPVKPGNVAVSIQSGPLGTAMLELANRLGVGISTFVSLGNKGDVSANDLLNFWDDDPSTEVVLLYTESFGNPRKFGRIARRVSRRKPIVAVKASRVLDDDEAADALYQRAGVIRVPTVRDLFDTGRVLASQPLMGGPAVAVVTNATSPAVLARDGLSSAGLTVARLGVDTINELSHQLPHQAVIGEAVDLTFRAEPADYQRALTAVVHDLGVDAVVVIYAPPILAALDEVADVVTRVAAEGGKPMVAVMLGRDDGPLAAASTVPAFSFPELAVEALGRVWRYSRWRARPEGSHPDLVDIDLPAARALVEHAVTVRPQGTLLPVSVTQELLATHGIAFAPARAVTSREDAVDAAKAVGFPVTVKAAGLARLARSESGGVALDLQSADEVAAAYDRMRAALGSGMAEAIVQHMVPAGVETIVSVEAHPSFGPVVSFGLGGAFADAIADRSSHSLPLTDLDAVDLVAQSRAAVALALAAADLAPLHDLLLRVGRLVDEVPEIERLRLNPVLVSAQGSCAVDAQIHVKPVPADPYDVPLRRLG